MLAMKRLYTYVLLLFFGTSLLPGVLHASKENNIKAAYLYQIIHFAEWPKYRRSSGIFNICVFGNDEIGDKLSPLHMWHVEDGHIEVLFPKKTTNIMSCDILYISDEKEDQLSLIFEMTRNTPVMTISSIEDFIKQGGMIGFTILHNTVRLEINHSVAIQADVFLSAKLLEIASSVIHEQREKIQIEDRSL